MLALPGELCRNILVQAAFDDPCTAHLLAFVSRAVCAWTSLSRWRTIVITRLEQLILLSRALASCQRGGLISMPDGQPAMHVRNLFIETSATADMRDELTHALRDCEMQAHALLRFFPNVRVLSLGGAEFDLFGASIGHVAPVSLTLVYLGNEAKLREALSPPQQTPQEPSVRSRLRHLHVIGVDPSSELTGLQMPVHILESLTAGSTSRGSLLREFVFDCEHPDNGEIPGIEHLRYDTRKFSYRPTDIFASRLRPLMQELAVRDVEDGASADTKSTRRTRALLERWGCGRFRQLEICWRNDPPTKQNTTPAAPMGVSERHGVAGARDNQERAVTEQRTRLNSSLYTGDWPAELRGAWTDRGTSFPNVHEAFRAELRESVTNLFGWSATAKRSPNAWLVPDGEYCERIREGFTPSDHDALERARMQAFLAHSAEAESESVDGTDPADLVFRVRTPSKYLALGTQQAALFPDERLDLFHQNTARFAGA